MSVKALPVIDRIDVMAVAKCLGFDPSSLGLEVEAAFAIADREELDRLHNCMDDQSLNTLIKLYHRNIAEGRDSGYAEAVIRLIGRKYFLKPLPPPEPPDTE